jgi:hypothetical protein
MTLQEAKSIARHLGLTLRQVRSGAYRVNFRDGNETTAYYTDNLEDAVNTAVEMARKRAGAGLDLASPDDCRAGPSQAGHTRAVMTAAHATPFWLGRTNVWRRVTSPRTGTKRPTNEWRSRAHNQGNTRGPAK